MKFNSKIYLESSTLILQYFSTASNRASLLL